MSNVIIGQAPANHLRSPENPRKSMEPEADMKPDDARQFIHDLMSGIHKRAGDIANDEFNEPVGNHLPAMEKAKQHYNNDTYQLLAGTKNMPKTTGFTLPHSSFGNSEIKRFICSTHQQ